LSLVLAVARAVVEAPEIQWCEEHDPLRFAGNTPGCPDLPDCRLVRVFLVPAEEET
jgi:hypothetical protein